MALESMGGKKHNFARSLWDQLWTLILTMDAVILNLFQNQLYHNQMDKKYQQTDFQIRSPGPRPPEMLEHFLRYNFFQFLKIFLIFYRVATGMVCIATITLPW